MLLFSGPLCFMLYRTSNPTLMACSLLLLLLILDIKGFSFFCLFIFQNSPLCRGPFPPRVGPVLSQIQRAQILNSQVDVSLFIFRSVTLSKTTLGEDGLCRWSRRSNFSYFYMILYKANIFPTAFIVNNSIKHSVQPTESSQPVQLLLEVRDEGCHNCDIYQLNLVLSPNHLVTGFWLYYTSVIK